jgi:hypothetical protein
VSRAALHKRKKHLSGGTWRRYPKVPTLQGDGILTNRLDSHVWDHSLAALEYWRHANLFPLDGDLESVSAIRRQQPNVLYLGGIIDGLHRFTNLGANSFEHKRFILSVGPPVTMSCLTVSRNESNGVFTLMEK